MAALGTKKAKKVNKTSAKKGKPVKKLSKLSRFNFKNPKTIMLATFVFAFVVSGSYWLYASSSAAAGKDLTTVQGCRASGVILKQGSSGSCVRVVQIILHDAKIKYGADANWGAITVDGKYGPITALTVAAYQQHVNRTSLARTRGTIAVDGIVGPDTWWWLQQVTCPDLAAYDLHACGR